jgi:N-methylhydantoinase A
VPYTRSLMQSFQREHQRRYGYSYSDRGVELVTLRLRATMKSAQVPERWKTSSSSTARPSSHEQAAVLFDGKRLNTAIHAREHLSVGKKFSGPAVVTEYSATTVVPKGKRFSLDRAGNLVIEIR